MEMEISEIGRQGQESETRRNRDEWRGVRDGSEKEIRGVTEKRWSRAELSEIHQ